MQLSRCVDRSPSLLTSCLAWCGVCWTMMKFSIEPTTSYNSIHPAYHHTEQFANNGEVYRESTRWYGVFLAFLSGAFFTISAALVKVVRNVNPMILLAIRALLQSLVMTVVACRSSKNLFGPSGRRILIHFQVRVDDICISSSYVNFYNFH